MIAQVPALSDRGYRAPTRSELGDATVERIKSGSGFNPDVYTVDIGGGPVVVKDYASNGWLARLIGRIQIARECGAYRVLKDHPGVVPFVGRIDALALATKKLDIIEIGWAQDKDRYGGMLFDQFRSIIDRMHTLGVAHLDLRCRRNVVMDRDYQVYLLDFASAQYLRPGGIPHRLFFHFFKNIDSLAVPKYKRLLGLELSEGDRRLVKTYNFWRYLWPFNLEKRRNP